MKGFPVLLSWLLALAVAAGVACAPRSSPAAAPTPAPAPLPTASPSTAAQPSPADTAWQKVISAGRKEGRVTLYTYTFAGDVGMAVAKGFRDRYGIRVDLITGRGAEQLERLKTERRMGQMVADIFEGASTHTLNAKKAGITLKSVDLPVLQEKGVWEIEPGNFDIDGHVLQYTYHVGTPHINTNLVKANDEPQSWYDLIAPKWKGKIVMADPIISTVLYNYLLPMVKREVVRRSYVEELAAQNPFLVRSNRDIADSLARGEYPLGFTVTNDAASFIAEGAPIKAIPMKEGMMVSGLVFTVVKDSPNPNAARLFADWILSQEGQLVQARARSGAGVRKDSPNFFPPGARVTGKLLTITADEAEETSEAFAKRQWVDLFKKK